MSPRTHTDTRQSRFTSSPEPVEEEASLPQVISQEFSSSHARSGQNRQEQSQRRARFWTSSSVSSRDGHSSSSYGSNSAKSDSAGKPERVVSPYGSFFVDDMEFSSPEGSHASSQGSSPGGALEVPGPSSAHGLHYPPRLDHLRLALQPTGNTNSQVSTRGAVVGTDPSLSPQTLAVHSHQVYGEYAYRRDRGRRASRWDDTVTSMGQPSVAPSNAGSSRSGRARRHTRRQPSDRTQNEVPLSHHEQWGTPDQRRRV
ncbi:hypothetical protein BC834DRAFT_132961 [Gloeopeniophorella convolvens]|nr:hypothetical protein BC834DRAFT_132961 [Gloeopeniophorella convolvens]